MTVTGEVFDPDGHPAAGCEVMVFHRGPKDVPRLATTATDPQGRFALTVGVQDSLEPVYVLARREGFALDWHGLIPGDPALLQLGAEPQACAGVVTGPDGAPVPGARVALGHLPFTCADGSVNLRDYPGHPLAVVTDAQGRFRIGGLPATHFLTVVGTADGYGRRTAGIPKDADPANLTLPLRPEATIRGRVVRDGQPVPGVSVFCEPEAGTKGGGDDRTVTDDQGVYTLRHLWFGTFVVMAEAPEGLVGQAIEGVTLAEGEHRTTGDIRLTPRAVVRGRVTEEGTGAPVEGARIRAYGPGRSEARDGFTDADGQYEFRLPPGEHRVRVLSPCHVWSHRPVKDPDEAAVTVAEGETCAGVDFAVPHFTHRFGPLPLEMAISLLPREISAYEPLVARVSIATAGYGAIELADSGNLNWRIQVRDPAGNLLAITPRQTLPCRLGFTTRTITPWQDLIQDIVVSALYTFSQPGEYEIRIQRLRLEEHFPLDAEASARVTVLPFDRARLDARCRELAGMERSMDQFPWFYALCSVRRDVALPYLDKWVGNTEASHAILAIGSPAAKAKFEALAARQDHVGKTARYVRDDEATRPRYRWPSGILPAPWPQPSRPTR